jgi:sulfide:quinone oxidoreductase
MTHPVRWLTEKIAIAGQITPEHMQSLAEMGFKSIICNRPDNEYGPGQPSAESIRDQAEAAGLRFAFLPVSGDGGTARDAQEMGTLLASLPAPILAYCYSGGRCMALIGNAARMGLPIPA